MVYGDRLMRILAEEALCRLPNVQTGAVETPCGNARGLLDKWKLDICLVSVVRSGKGPFTNYVYKRRRVSGKKTPIFCKLLYHRKCKRRGVGGQKKSNLVNVVCERPLY